MEWNSLAEAYEDLWELRDMRVEGWPLMSSPLPTVLICANYVILVTVVGPRFMRDRKPFQLRGFLVAYNCLQVVLNAWILRNVSASFEKM